jgi:hypothetical protein
MIPKLEISLFDDSVFSIRFPPLRYNIAVLVSGGLDSALLYYLVKYLSMQDARYKVTPYTLERKDGSKTHAQEIIDYVHDTLGCERKDTTYIPITNEDTNLQVAEGIRSLLTFNKNSKVLYMGYILTLSEHTLHGVPSPYYPKDSDFFKSPLKDFTKAHVVNLIVKLNVEKLFEITHSCVYDIDGRCNECNRCNERAWAFKQLGLVDPGTN